VNSRFAEKTGIVAASLAIHCVGLAAISVIVLASSRSRRKASRESKTRPPFYYYLGGVIGVGTVFSSTYAFSSLGASLAVALALFGQTLFSLAADATAFLGRERHPLRPRRIPGLALALAGIAAMTNGLRELRFLPAAAALLSGMLPGLSSVLNAELGRRRGFLTSTLANYLTGLATTALVAVACLGAASGDGFGAATAGIAAALSAIASAGPILVCGGGLMGVLAVTSMSGVFSRMSAFAATLLIFCGQAVAGLSIDFASTASIDVGKLVGTILLLAGLALDSALARGSRA
jgi:Uncharacterized protein conserved in bacteria